MEEEVELLFTLPYRTFWPLVFETRVEAVYLVLVTPLVYFSSTVF